MVSKMRYKYFVSYFYEKGNDPDIVTGYGNTDLTFIKKIENIDDIREIERKICDQMGNDRCLILNFIALGEVS